VTALVQNKESGEFARVDYATEAWKERLEAGSGRTGEGGDGGERTPAMAMVLGYWKGVVPEPGAKRRLLVDDASLIELFEQSEQEVDPSVASVDDRLAFRFMLALILLRKKLLICEKTVGKNMMVRARGSLKASEGGELMEVVDPGMDDALAARVTGQLAAVLEG